MTFLSSLCTPSHHQVTFVMYLPRLLLFTSYRRFTSRFFTLSACPSVSSASSAWHPLHSCLRQYSSHTHFQLKNGLGERVSSLPQLYSHRMCFSDDAGVSKPAQELPPTPPTSTPTSTSPTDTSASPAPSPPTATARLTLSAQCQARLSAVLDADEILRIGVRGGGCSGFEYEYSVVKRTTIHPEEDLLFEEKVVVDKESIEYMKDSVLDYSEELIRSGFQIVNPMAEKGCSCGASFSLKF